MQYFLIAKDVKPSKCLFLEDWINFGILIQWNIFHPLKKLALLHIKMEQVFDLLC